ncbi:HAMP domain-containing sensor histidine kinase [Kribbella sp. NPDC026611]|uniref:sensor histidine kinase n=1 Tax=Kribbella sp. NPDC026611 TaxID=3154911 RepID=UPI0033E124BE
MKVQKLPRFTIRGRFTLAYGGLVLLAGIVFLALTYLLVSQRLHADQPMVDTVRSATPAPSGAAPQPTVGAPSSPSGSQLDVRGVTDNALDSLLGFGALVLAVVVAAATAIAWLIAGQMLQPLQRVTETARRIAGAPPADPGLHERLAFEGPNDELKELADTFDLMLGRLDQAFDSQRRFIANASHELRSPLAVNRALLEIAVHRQSASADLRELSETLLEVNGRHERLIDGLLVLARSKVELTAESYVDLADIAEHVTEQHVGASVTLIDELEEAPTTGSAVLLERLVHNLVDNAIRYNVPDGWVRVTTGKRSNDRAMIVVSNTGPTVRRYEIPTIFEPFSRLDHDRPNKPTGVGLGLSIVEAIAHAHGGTVEAEPRPDGGLTVQVTFPAHSSTTPDD